MAITNATIANYVVDNFKCVGINIQVAQGDQTKSYFYPGVKPADVKVISDAIESTGEFTVTGFAPVMRLETYLEGTLKPVAGTADNTKFKKIGLTRTAKIGEEDVKLQTLYLPLPLSDNDTKVDALVNALKGKKIGEATIEDVKMSSSVSLGSTTAEA